jgi:hypothetical protein
MTTRNCFCGVVALLLTTALILSGCNKKEEPKSTASAPAATAPATNPEAKAPQVAPAAAPSVPATPTSGSGAKAIQTQMGMTGDVEVDLVKANVQDGVLTVTLSYRNNGKADMKLKQISLEEVYFLSEAEKKKYHVLKDSKGAWIAAPVARGVLGYESGFGANPVIVSPAGKAVVWFKFPAPPDSVAMVNLVVPDVMPFDKMPISR